MHNHIIIVVILDELYVFYGNAELGIFKTPTNTGINTTTEHMHTHRNGDCRKCLL